MAARNLLHKDKLEAFKAWLDFTEREYRPGRGDWQVLQVKLRSGWVPVFERAEMPEHLTVPEKLIGLVRLFLQDTRRIEVPTASPSATTQPWE